MARQQQLVVDMGFSYFRDQHAAIIVTSCGSGDKTMVSYSLVPRPIRCIHGSGKLSRKHLYIVECKQTVISRPSLTTSNDYQIYWSHSSSLGPFLIQCRCGPHQLLARQRVGIFGSCDSCEERVGQNLYMSVVLLSLR